MMAIFVVFNLFKRVADQAKNICDQTVFAVRGIAKMPKVYRILFLDQPAPDWASWPQPLGARTFRRRRIHLRDPGCCGLRVAALLEFLRKPACRRDLTRSTGSARTRSLGLHVIVSCNGVLQTMSRKCLSTPRH